MVCRTWFGRPDGVMGLKPGPILFLFFCCGAHASLAYTCQCSRCVQTTMPAPSVDMWLLAVIYLTDQAFDSLHRCYVQHRAQVWLFVGFVGCDPAKTGHCHAMA